MTTTQRILALGGDPQGSSDFLWKVNQNNPLDADFWNVCITNNPGGFVPNHNPSEWEHMVEVMRADYRKHSQSLAKSL